MCGLEKSGCVTTHQYQTTLMCKDIFEASMQLLHTLINIITADCCLQQREQKQQNLDCKWKTEMIQGVGENHVTQWLSLSLVISECTKYVKTEGWRETLMQRMQKMLFGHTTLYLDYLMIHPIGFIVFSAKLLLYLLHSEWPYDTHYKVRNRRKRKKEIQSWQYSPRQRKIALLICIRLSEQFLLYTNQYIIRFVFLQTCHMAIQFRSLVALIISRNCGFRLNTLRF